MKGSLRVASIAGIEISIHYTWLLIFVLITWTLAAGYFPETHPGWATEVYWITALIAAFLLFFSVLLHEFAHSIMAKSRGMEVKSITLFLLGGISNLESEPEKPQVEFAIAIIGPLSSLALAAVFWGVDKLGWASAGPVKAITDYLMLVNILLAAFNILPGFPLDGGRVLRSLIWGATNDLKKATNIASTVGQVFGWGMIAIGIFWAWRYWNIPGQALNGMWLVFIGWFLNSSAQAARQELDLRTIWLNVKVNSVMNDRPETVTPGASIEQLVRDIFIKRGARSAPVVQDDKLVGMVTLTDVKKMHQQEWPMTSIARIMTKPPLYTVKPDDSMSVAINLIAEHGINQVPVVVEEKVVGTLCRADILRYVQIHYELDRKES
jgi:Zn-dependent protease/CBS domain-containing protein